MSRVGIIDYGMGNLHSVQKALQKVGTIADLIKDPLELSQFERLILPGVGAFGDVMTNLRRANFVEPILQVVNRGVPFLGICLGMQVLFTKGEELGNHDGLGLLPGTVSYLDVSGKVPHMGWNELQLCGASPLLENLGEHPFVYFANSFVVHPEDSNVIAGETEYEKKFPSVVWHKNIYGVQFHPEKSQYVGLKILKNFVEQC